MRMDEDVTRISVSGDWHGNTRAARWAVREAQRAGSEGIVHTGDFGIWPGEGGQEFLDQLDADLEEAGLWCAFVDGNHEDFDQLDAIGLDARGLRPVRTRITHLPRGTRWRWSGLDWMALGGATSLDRPRRRAGTSWWPQEELTDTDLETARSGGPVDVMVTHDCPRGVEVPDLPPASLWDPHELERANVHRARLRTVVDAVGPTHLFHGHFHVRYQAALKDAGLNAVVVGLDCDGSGERSILHLDLEELAEESRMLRSELG